MTQWNDSAEEENVVVQQSIFLRYKVIPVLVICSLVGMMVAKIFSLHPASATGPVDAAFTQATHESGVPAELLKSLCYMEGRLSNHGGSPSIDNGYGCMHLVKSKRANTLDRAAKDLGVSEQQLKQDIATNIRGGAALLRDYALQVSTTHTLPTKLSDWYGAVAAYSNATTQRTARMYADGVYSLLKRGFAARADTGETVTLMPQNVKPNSAMVPAGKDDGALPAGCVDDGNVDYPGAINCILDPRTYDCNAVASKAPCTYESAYRPRDYKPSQVVIHDIEGTAQDALNVFQDVNSGVSTQYIVDSDGTVYEVLRDKDIGYQAGNFWYNQRTIGIEHAGYDAAGWQWYNAAEYLASAKLTAYLLKKYHLPLDHDHILSHGTVPAPTLAYTPNHVDPGPFWLWDYYFKLIHQQGIPYARRDTNAQIITLRPATGKQPLGDDGAETEDNFNFFYLYTSASTASPLVRPAGDGADITDETNTIEPGMSFSYLDKREDPAGSGKMLYEIWYGEEPSAHALPASYFANAKLAWLAVPPDAAMEGSGTIVKLKSPDGQAVPISGKPGAGSEYYIGDAPVGAQFVSAYKVLEDGTNSTWYEINYNHRQAWVPASAVEAVNS